MSASASTRPVSPRRCGPSWHGKPPGSAAAARLDLFRRRHAEPDGAGDRGRADRRCAAAFRLSRRLRDHARSQPDQRRGGQAARLRARPASTASRSACRASMRPRCAFSDASTRPGRRSPRSRWRAALFPRVSFDLIYARPGPVATPRGGTSCGRRSRSRRTTCRSTSSRSRPGTVVRGPPPPRRVRAAGRGRRRGPLRGNDRGGRPARPRALRGQQLRRRPAHESRHNLAYWRYSDYAGIGPGAHGRLTLDGGAARNTAPPRAGTVGGARRTRRPRQHRRRTSRLRRRARGRCC